MSNWIDVNDRLPKLDGRTPVLIVSDWVGEVVTAVPCITWRNPEDLDECAAWRDGEYVNVAYWMPIPELPGSRKFKKSYDNCENNVGNQNTSYWDIDDHGNTGSGNLGYENTGDYNSGEQNTGNYNIGCWNVGDRNTGDHNIGDWNTGCYNTGVFCESDDIFIKMFDRPTNWTLLDWKDSEAYKILETAPCSIMMSEKKLTAATQQWWDNLSIEEREEIYHLPNFSAKKFERIMHGISIGLGAIPFSDEE